MINVYGRDALFGNKTNEGGNMKIIDGFVSKGIYVIVTGMFLYLITTGLAITHCEGINHCQACEKVNTASYINH